MTLRAFNGKKEEVISYIRNPLEIKQMELSCPSCEQKMIFVNATLKIKHFRHERTECIYKTEPDSKTHMNMKKEISEILKENGRITLEKKIGSNITDIAIETPTNQKIAVECQASPITFNEFMTRTKNLNKEGWSVLWIFHIKKITKDCTPEIYKFGQNPTISTRTGKFLLFLHKMYFGRVYFWSEQDIKIKENIMESGEAFETEEFSIEKGLHAAHFNSKTRRIWKSNFNDFDEEYKDIPYKEIKYISFKKITNFTLYEYDNERTETKISKFNDPNWWIS